MSEPDFDLLTKMTLELSEQCELHLEDGLEDGSKEKLEGPIPGLIFFLEAGAHTFCVRALAVEDLEEGLDWVGKGHPEAEEALRAKIPLERRQYNVFPTDSKIAAEVLVDQMANRRYSLRADWPRELSDPGLNWWMQSAPGSTPGRLQIFFQSYQAHRKSSYMALGPMGDAHIACKRFLQALPFLRELFPVNEFSVNEHSLSVGVNIPDDPHFASFRNLFLQGKMGWEEELFLPAGKCAKTLFLYFQELALKRRFWCKVEALLPRPERLGPESRP